MALPEILVKIGCISNLGCILKYNDMCIKKFKSPSIISLVSYLTSVPRRELPLNFCGQH